MQPTTLLSLLSLAPCASAAKLTAYYEYDWENHDTAPEVHTKLGEHIPTEGLWTQQYWLSYNWTGGDSKCVKLCYACQELEYRCRYYNSPKEKITKAIIYPWDGPESHAKVKCCTGKGPHEWEA